MTTPLLVLATLLLLAVGAAVVAYWAVFRRPLPRTSGTLSAPSLAAPARISRDRDGVPHVTAESWPDLAYAVGFAHGQDRFWQMELQRRVAAGRLSEVIGPGGLASDRLMRKLGLHRVSEAEWHVTHAAGDIRRILTAYTDGVNAAIGDRPLPAEFSVLRHRPGPWTPEDSLAVGRLLSFSQAANWEAQLGRVRLLREVGAELTAEIDPGYPAGDPLVLEPGATAPELGGELLDQLRATDELLGLSAWAAASNTWVVSAAHTTTGAPILASDPHGAISLPSPWYQVHLQLPDEELAGVTLVGAPFVLLGHNRRIAWGLANANVSIQDLYVERFNPNNPLQFDDAGRWQDAVRFREVIRVKGAEPVIEDVVVTRRGPVVSSALPGRQPPLSLRWVALDSEIDSIGWALRLNRAGDWKSFRAAVGACASPALTVSYADVDGNIGCRLSGFIPLRRPGAGRLPSMGWDRADEWQGFVAFEDVPEVFNPPSGVVIAANNLVSATGPVLAGEPSPGYRATRIAEMLASAGRTGVDDHVAIQMDVLSLPAVQLRALVLDRLDRPGAVPAEPGLLAALGLLREWDCRMDGSSAAALLYWKLQLHLAHRYLGGAGPAALHHAAGGAVVVGSGAGPFLGRFTPVLLRGLAEGRPRAGAPPDLDASDALLAECLLEAAAELRAAYGEPTRWRWGEFRQVAFDHPLATALPVLRPLFSRGPFPTRGETHTIHQAGGAPPPMRGPSWAPFYRAVYDLADWSRSRAGYPPGQSGHPASPHYADMTADWLAGGSRPLMFGPLDPAALGWESLDLLPADNPGRG